MTTIDTRFTAKLLTPTRPNLVDINAFFSIGSYSPLAVDFDAIDGEIYNVLTTVPGTCEFEPEYGAAFLLRVFDPNDQQTYDYVRFDVYNAVRRWVPGVTVDLDNTFVTPQVKGFLLTTAYYVNLNGARGSVVIDFGELP